MRDGRAGEREIDRHRGKALFGQAVTHLALEALHRLEQIAVEVAQLHGDLDGVLVAAGPCVGDLRVAAGDQLHRALQRAWSDLGLPALLVLVECDSDACQVRARQ